MEPVDILRQIRENDELLKQLTREDPRFNEKEIRDAHNK